MGHASPEQWHPAPALPQRSAVMVDHREAEPADAEWAEASIRRHGTPARTPMGAAHPARHPARDAARAARAAVSDTDVDLRLMERVQGRDEAALGALYDRWSDRVYAVALQLVGDRHHAEEVVEKAFTQVWIEANRYHTGWGSVEAWIILIARGHARAGLARRAEAVPAPHGPQRGQS